MTPSSTDEWSTPRPAGLPAPTYWPATLAAASALLLWGLLTSWGVSAVGLGLFVVGLTGWIRDVLREHAQEEP